MSDIRQGQQVPVTSTSGMQGGAASRGGRGESKEEAGEILHKVAKKGEQVYHAACDACHNWRHYPKLLTVSLLLLSFLGGAMTLGMVKKTGIMGSGGSYISSHWDRNTADAHHALDVILDHLQHPELYESTKHGVSTVTKARGKLGDFLSGIMPAGWGRKPSRGYGRDMDMEHLEHEGKKWMPSGKGWMGGDKGYTGELYEKMGDITGDAGYRMKRGMETGMEQAKDVGYGLTHKMGEMAEAVKSKFTGGGRGYEEGEYMGRGGDMKEKLKRGMGMGGRYRDEDEDEVELATQKLRRVVRQADRDL